MDSTASATPENTPSPPPDWALAQITALQAELKHRDLKILARSEMGEHAALGHFHAVRQHPDRQALEPDTRRDFQRGVVHSPVDLQLLARRGAFGRWSARATGSLAARDGVHHGQEFDMGKSAFLYIGNQKLFRLE